MNNHNILKRFTVLLFSLLLIFLLSKTLKGFAQTRFASPPPQQTSINNSGGEPLPEPSGCPICDCPPDIEVDSAFAKRVINSEALLRKIDADLKAIKSGKSKAKYVKKIRENPDRTLTFSIEAVNPTGDKESIVLRERVLCDCKNTADCNKGQLMGESDCAICDFPRDENGDPKPGKKKQCMFAENIPNTNPADGMTHTAECVRDAKGGGKGSGVCKAPKKCNYTTCLCE